MKGFTLVEAVLALAIMALSAFALMSAASRCVAVARTARNYQTAVSVLDKGELDHPLVLTNKVSDNIVEPITDENGFTFARDIQPTNPGDKNEEDMFMARTTVSWSVKGKSSFEEVTTYLYSTNHEEGGL